MYLWIYHWISAFAFSVETKSFGISSFGALPSHLRKNRIVINETEIEAIRFLYAKKFLTLKFGLLQVIGYSKTWQNLSRFCRSNEIGEERKRVHPRVEKKAQET